MCLTRTQVSNKKISDADSFQIRLEVNSLLDPEYHGGNIHTGLGYTMIEDVKAGASTGSYNSFFNIGDDTRRDLTIFFTKVNNIIYINGYYKSRSYSTVVNTSPELGEMVFKILMNKHSNGIVRLSYKDLNS